MLTVVLRNFAVEILFYAFWHWFLYSATSPGAHRMKPQKFNPINPYAHMCTLRTLWFSTLTRTVAPHRYEDKSRAHLPREVLFTTLGFCMSSAFEIGMMHAWATGTLRVLTSRLVPVRPFTSRCCRSLPCLCRGCLHVCRLLGLPALVCGKHSGHPLLAGRSLLVHPSVSLLRHTHSFVQTRQ